VRDAELYAKTLADQHLKAQLACCDGRGSAALGEKLDAEIEQSSCARRTRGGVAEE